MSGVVAGFSVIFIIIAVGYILGRRDVLGPTGEQVLSRLVFFVATPALLFDSLAHADLSVIFSSTLVVAGGSAFIVGLGYLVVARVWWHRPIPEAVIGALASSYVNSVNLGIPIAVFVLGDASFVAPLLLFQIVIYSPIALTAMDLTVLRDRSPAWYAPFVQPFRNPIVLAGLAGLLLAVTGWSLPEALLQPFHLLGGASVPGALLAFGISLNGVRILKRGESPRRDVALASVLKIVVQPLVAYLIGRHLLDLTGHALLAAVIIATLPTAQNVFTYASRYQRGMMLARDAGLVTTLAAIPAIALGTALLG